ncbi:MAG: DUF1385 domain-containing protein [Candidatus Woesearchaeota archaeon]
MKPLIGGQAVIEGVMMKGPSHYAISVRTPKGKIKTKIESLKKRRFKPFRWPIFRGFLGMIDMLILGIKSLEWSANQAEDEPQEMNWKEFVILMIISIGFAVILFIVAPLFLTGLFTESNGITFNIIDGIIRIIFFIIYLLAIGMMSDIKILFQYHGAEHKTVNCYEADQELTLENVKKFTTTHPRCGTSFILIVMVLSIAFFSIVTSDSWLIKFATRLVFIPIIAGISYEIIHYSAKHKDNTYLNALISPGLLLQKLTTKEPDNKQLQVAITALKSVLDRTK